MLPEPLHLLLLTSPLSLFENLDKPVNVAEGHAELSGSICVLNLVDFASFGYHIIEILSVENLIPMILLRVARLLSF